MKVKSKNSLLAFLYCLIWKLTLSDVIDPGKGDCRRMLVNVFIRTS